MSKLKFIDSYSGKDLGAVWTINQTTFKVWAPTADLVCVNFYKSGDAAKRDLINKYEMSRREQGIWELTVKGDLNGMFYTYAVNIADETYETCDPYAKATGVNGDRAMVINLDSTDPDGWNEDVNPNSNMNITDAIIYEVHVKDISADASSGIKQNGKYLGLTELNTVNANGKPTGLSHIIDMGVTHIQLTPVYDFATVDEGINSLQYNWGYDPKNYNVPEGSYSANPFKGDLRIRELKELIQTCHKNGLSVVMDVVYNHTYDTNFCFNRIFPDYFYRKGSDGTGCGNDVASERTMVRKYIVDSVVYWAREYHIDGFRFDLVGILDIDTINEIREKLDAIDPSIILYGEGWKLNTITSVGGILLATQENIDNLNRFAMFNDVIRDSVRGSVFEATEKGYIGGNLECTENVKNALAGSCGWSDKPCQQINYVSCHDNLTLWDKISSADPSASFEKKVKENLLAASIIFMAQGTPFMLAGEELLRTKPGEDGTFDENSYKSPITVNSIKWNVLGNAEYDAVYDYYKGLISFRKAHKILRSVSEAKAMYSFKECTEKGVIAYEINSNTEDKAIFAVFNPLEKDVCVDLPAGKWNVYINGHKAGNTVIDTVCDKITVSSVACTVLVAE